MTSQLISLNEYRKNISTLWKKAQKENIKYIVLSHSKPIFEVNPITNNEIPDDWDLQYTPANHKAWLQAQKDLKDKKTIPVDLENIKTEEDFIHLIKN
ncbi:MAG: hypothetical protein H6767_00845 [Candidatus Peribacteria bacterium]|nr:MAG: hypothetical protein H6767_00845 [Candidatus Peribacteria bacterium]